MDTREESQRKLETVFQSEADDEYLQIERIIDQNIFEQALFNELKKYDLVKQNTFLLRFQQQLTIKEISEIQDCAIGTIKSRLFYMIKELAVKLKAFHPDNEEVG